MRWMIVVFLTLLGLFPASACLWDRDTLAVERQRFPTALELITGRFERHSEAYYAWRVRDRTAKLQRAPGDLDLLDDLAVALDKLGRHEQAVHIMQDQTQIDPDRYETQANLGTFLIHSGQFEEGLNHIEKAIEINPDAHFGREVYQKLLVEYVLARKGEAGAIPSPLGDLEASIHEPRGFAAFVLEQQGTPSDLAAVQAEIRRAAKGVSGMMRFGNHDASVLLEALGDLLHSYGLMDDAKRLAARAYLKASYEVEDGDARTAYRTLAERALGMQVAGRLSTREITLAEVERKFVKELKDAREFFEKIEANEQAWIDAGKDVDAEYDRKYYTRK